jgi:hypothetical protein
VRLWEYDRAVPHLVGTPTLLSYARRSGLRALEAEIDALVRSVSKGGRAPA